MNICVVGTGYVGLVTGACFAEFGNPVICVDNNRAKIEGLLAGRLPIYEPGLDDLVERNVKAGRLRFTTDLAESVRDSLVVFIAVGTPQGDDGRADLSFVREVARTIARHLNSYKVVVTKSTVPAGTGRMIREIIEQNMVEPHPFSVASNPEFLREGSAVADSLYPDRIVVGADFEQQHLVHFVPHRAQHDDGRGHAGRAQLFADLRTVHAGKPQVHQDEVGLRRHGLLEAAATVAAQNRAETFLLQHDPYGVAKAFVIIDNENGLHFVVN